MSGAEWVVMPFLIIGTALSAWLNWKLWPLAWRTRRDRRGQDRAQP